MSATEDLVQRRGTLSVKEKLRIPSQAVEMDTTYQWYTLGQLITDIQRRFGFDLWPKTASQAEKPSSPSKQLILPSWHLCFLPIHCGGANDSIVRLTPSLYTLMFIYLRT